MIGRRPHDDAQEFEDAWNGGKPANEAVAELVRFAETLCESAVVEPSPEFRGALRERIMTEAATALVPMPGASRAAPSGPTRKSRSGRRRIVALATALIASAGAVSLVASSASALPGDLLYPVKRTAESVEMNLHRSDSSRGAFQLAQATERLAEARQLSAQNASPTLIAKALDSFSDSASSGSARLFSDFTSSGHEKSVRKVNDFAADSSNDLTALSTVLPTEAAPALTTATDTVSKLATEATSLCVTCVSADVQSLVTSVSNLTKKQPKSGTPGGTTTPDSTPPARGNGSGTTTGGKPAGGTPATRAPSKPDSAPTAAAPTTPAPPATTKPPSLTDITDPLLGGLLGDENQEGLVPGLLNGLLGGGK